MEPVLTPEAMRAADEAAIAGGVPGEVLMDRAAHACAVVVLRRLGGAYGHRVTIVCGKGNNGGDGIACGRHLAAAGARAMVFLLDEPSGVAATHLEIARRRGGEGLRIEPFTRRSFEREARRADLVVDAVFGTGFDGAPRGLAAEAIEAMNASTAPVVAVDIASGVSGADGRVPGVAVRAELTVAVQSLKVGHVVAPGALCAGRVEVADIGIAVGGPTAWVPQAHDVAAVLPRRAPDAHKYSVGAVGVLAGSAGMSGAAILTARGAAGAGAGLVLCGVPRSSVEVFEDAVTEAVKVPMADADGQLTAKALDEVAERFARVRAVATGPGIGGGRVAVDFVERILELPVPLVIDADGLWALTEILEGDPDALRDRPPVVLTPHAGEFERLTGEAPASPEHVAATAARLGAVVHLKGPRAVTAAPDGRRWFNPTGNPGAATGGTGDVLTGVIASLVAQGLEPTEATWAGAYVHGLAADIAAARAGVASMGANDLASALGSALRVSRATAPTGRLRRVLEAL